MSIFVSVSQARHDKKLNKYFIIIINHIFQRLFKLIFEKKHNNTFAGYFEGKNTLEHLIYKYYWSEMIVRAKNNIKSYDIWTKNRVKKDTLYFDLEFLPVLINPLKDFLIASIASLWESKNWHKVKYNSIHIIVDELIKIVK